jgi:hypothetical protein
MDYNSVNRLFQWSDNFFQINGDYTTFTVAHGFRFFIPFMKKKKWNQNPLHFVDKYIDTEVFFGSLFMTSHIVDLLFSFSLISLIWFSVSLCNMSLFLIRLNLILSDGWIRH